MKRAGRGTRSRTHVIIIIIIIHAESSRDYDRKRVAALVGQFAIIQRRRGICGRPGKSSKPNARVFPLMAGRIVGPRKCMK